jgi:SAM-dependent methyltransferase
MDDVRRRAWSERHLADPHAREPSPFVVAALARLGPPRAGARALDLACGRGRHALLLARRGYLVDAVDWALPALATLARAARAEALAVSGVAADLATWPLPRTRYDLVLVVRFLARTRLEEMRDAVAPGGALLIETFLAGQERWGRPRSPEHLLRPGELARLCRGLDVLAAHEGPTERGGRPAMLAGILARRPAR